MSLFPPQHKVRPAYWPASSPRFWLLFCALVITCLAAPSFAYNIEITGVEVSQGIQNMDNDMPLIMGRRIIVRTYARVTTGETLPDVQARVLVSWSYSLESNGLEGGGGGGGMTLDSEPATLSPGVPSRLDYQASLNTEIEISIPTGIDEDVPVDFEVEVIVNHAHLGEEDNTTDNTMVVTSHMQVPDPLHVKFVPIHLHHSQTNEVLEPGFWDNSIALLYALAPLRHHPIAENRFSFNWSNIPLEPFGHAMGNEWDMSAVAAHDDILARLGTLHMLEGNPATTVMSGMVAPGAAPASAPRGKATGSQFWQIMDDSQHYGADWFRYGPGVLAHELGHLRGVQHVECSGSEPGPDGNYPWPSSPGGECQIADLDSDGYYGLDIYRLNGFHLDPSIISNNNTEAHPNRGYPLMGYWRPMWVSPYETCRMMKFGYGMDCDLSWPTAQVGTFIPASVKTLVNANQHIWISGLLDIVRDQATLMPFYRQDAASDALIEQAVDRRIKDANHGAKTRYSVALKDAQGKLLYEHVVYQHEEGDRGDDDLGESETLILNDLLPFPAKTASIEVLADGRQIAQRSVNASAPSLQLMMPSTPNLVAGQVLAWQASAAEGAGDSMAYSAFYITNADSSESVPDSQVLAFEIQDSYLVLTEEHLESMGGTEGRIKVVVSDGVNSSHKISGIYETPNPKPKALILTASERTDRRAVVLEGMAVDRDEGFLTRDSVSWSSSIDGFVGYGERLQPELSPGRHIITFSATDSLGATAKATAKLEVSR